MQHPTAADLIQHVAARIRGRRLALGWSQETLARHLGIAPKGVQRLEYNGQNLTLSTLHKLAQVLSTTPESLLAETDLGPRATSRAAPLRLGGLRKAGWQVERTAERLPHDPPAIPVFDLQAAASVQSDASPAQVVGWATAPEGRRLTSAGLFLARVVGTSMAPLVKDGDWCLFRQPVTPPLLGKVVLIQVRGPGDLDAQAGFHLKRVGAIEWKSLDVLQIRLDSTNRDVPPIVREVRDETEFTVAGELVEVLKASG